MESGDVVEVVDVDEDVEDGGTAPERIVVVVSDGELDVVVGRGVVVVGVGEIVLVVGRVVVVVGLTVVVVELVVVGVSSGPSITTRSTVTTSPPIKPERRNLISKSAPRYLLTSKESECTPPSVSTRYDSN